MSDARNSFSLYLERVAFPWSYKGTLEFRIGDHVAFTGVVESDDIDVVLDFLKPPASVLRTALEADDGRTVVADGKPEKWSRRDRDTAVEYLDAIEETAKSVYELVPRVIELHR